MFSIALAGLSSSGVATTYQGFCLSPIANVSPQSRSRAVVHPGTRGSVAQLPRTRDCSSSSTRLRSRSCRRVQGFSNCPRLCSREPFNRRSAASKLYSGAKAAKRWAVGPELLSKSSFAGQPAQHSSERRAGCDDSRAPPGRSPASNLLPLQTDNPEASERKSG